MKFNKLLKIKIIQKKNKKNNSIYKMSFFLMKIYKIRNKNLKVNNILIIKCFNKNI